MKEERDGDREKMDKKIYREKKMKRYTERKR